MASPMSKNKKNKKIEVLTANYPISVEPDTLGKKKLIIAEN
jgi:hypothetical protein